MKHGEPVPVLYTEEVQVIAQWCGSYWLDDVLEAERVSISEGMPLKRSCRGLFPKGPLQWHPLRYCDPSPSPRYWPEENLYRTPVRSLALLRQEHVGSHRESAGLGTGGPVIFRQRRGYR